MRKISIKDLIEFRNKSDVSKKTFVNNIKLDKKAINAEGGGNYWVIGISAISKSYRLNDLQFIVDKKEEFEAKYVKTQAAITRNMYKRNIDILYGYQDYDFKVWRPKKLQFVKRPEAIFSSKGLQIKTTPQHVFTFQKNEVDEIGAIWFVAKLDGFKIDELGMFADILYKYLKKHFSKDYKINSNYCIAVDVFSKLHVNYSQLESGEVTSVLSPTLDEIKKMM